MGLDKTQWSSSTDLEGEVPLVLGQATKWERSLECIDSKMAARPGGPGSWSVFGEAVGGCL